MADERTLEERVSAVQRWLEPFVLSGAAKAAEQGKAEKAEQLEERSAAVVAPVVHREAPKVAGVSMREVWKFEITDPSKVNPAFCIPDEVKIRKVVLAMKGDAANVLGEGVRVYVERQVASSAA